MTSTRTPSKFQQAIYNEVMFGIGNIFVTAVAGAGKTTTLEGIAAVMTLAQLRDTLFVAFSKKIQTELESRLPQGMWVRTFHSICYWNLKNALKTNPTVNKYKYIDIAEQMLLVRGFVKGTDELEVAKDALVAATNFARLTLCDLSSEEAFESMLVQYDIAPVDGLRKLVIEAIAIGARSVKTIIDYTDMVFMPIHLNIAMRKFGTLLVDEAQDLNNCQAEAAARMMHANSRIIFVGDRNQSVFGFAGATVDSVDRLIARFACKQMPLSVCYRCPSSHIEDVVDIVPQIVAREGAPVGVKGHLRYEEIFKAAKPGDLVICRYNAPLVDLAFEFLAEGIPATIEGRELLGELTNLARRVMKLPGANWEQFQSYLDELLARETAALARKKGTESRIEALADRAQALGIIVARAQAHDQRIKTIGGLESFMERIYSDSRGVVKLSSVHRAKGLEADNVFILGDEFMPSKKAVQDWQVQQEMNLRYVAHTRGKVSKFTVGLKPRREN